MNINGVSSSNQYLQAQNTGITGPGNTQTNEQSRDISKDTNTATNQDRSNQAFQVSITDQARQILRTEQTAMEATPSQDNTGKSQSNSYGPQKIIDLVA